MHEVPPSDPAYSPRPSSWPTVWGWLCLVYALPTLLFACCGALGALSGPLFGRMSGVQLPSPPQIIYIWMIIDVALTLVLLTALIMGGIALLRRRSMARQVLLFYVVVRLLIVPVQMVVGIAMERPQAEWQRQIAASIVEGMEQQGQPVDPNLRQAAQNTEPPPYARAITIGSSLLGAIFPVVLCIFLVRGTPEMRRWSA